MTNVLNTTRIQVWACGGGTQSVAIAAMIVQGRLPKPDLSVIADTELEKRSTWDYYDSVLVPELERVGVVIHRIKRSEFAFPWAKQLFDNSGQLLVPAFTNESGEGGKLPAFCSNGWKQEVVDNWLSRVHGVTKSKRRKWLGFSFDESTRWVKHHGKDDIWIPLVDGVRMNRRECVKLISDIGWPVAPRSNCWMCPNQSDNEWRETITNRPDEFARACEIEREIHQWDPHAFLHRSMVPLSQVDFSVRAYQREFELPCDSGHCFV